MSDRLTIFNRSGSAIAVFTDLYVDRGWNLRDSSSVAIQLPKTHVKATAENFAYGNRVLIENSALGQTWVGFLWPPRDEDEAQYIISAQSAERLFSLRITGQADAYSGAAGTIASSLVSSANSVEITGITADSADIDSSGGSLSKTYNFADIFNSLVKLAEESNMYFWVDGSRNATTGLLEMSFHWAAQRGITWPYQLEQGWNFEIDNYSEEGSPISSLTVYGKGDNPDWSSGPVYTATDADALATYGLSQAAVGSLDSEDTATVTTIATALIEQRSELRREVNGTITKAPFPAIGDVVTAKLRRFAFGAELTMKVGACAWDSRSNTMAVKLRET